MIRIRGIKPIYWGVEKRNPERLVPFDERRITRAWMVEDRLPWRKSVWGFRFRIGPYGMHLGLCRTQRPEERPWHGYYYSPNAIGQFRRVGEDEDAEEMGAEEVIPGGLDPGAEQIRSNGSR